MKDSTRSAIIAALAVLAVAFAAATLDSTVAPEGTPPGGAGGSGVGDDGNGGMAPPPQSEPTPGESLELPFLAELLTILAIIAVLGAIAYAVVYRREALRFALAIAALLGLLFVLVQLLSGSAGPPEPPMMPGGDGVVGDGGGGGGGDADATRPSLPSLLFLLVVGLAIVGVAVAVLRTGTDDGDDAAGEPGEERTDAAAVGRAAGRAANRLESASDVDNEVYRTWREMTELLDVDDPETSTPGEFATAAVEAGLGREEVDELTRLFEDVRYGETQPTADHERRAIALFRRIEDRYAEGDS